MYLDLLKMLGIKKTHIIPNGGLMVIYPGTKHKKITLSKSKYISDTSKIYVSDPAPSKTSRYTIAIRSFIRYSTFILGDLMFDIFVGEVVKQCTFQNRFEGELC